MIVSTVVFSLLVVGWLVLDWYMGWTARDMDAAIKELEEEQRKRVSVPAADLAVVGLGLITTLIVLAMILGRT